jgi:phage terminase small subunit
MATIGGLSPKQRRFLETLLSGVSVAQACRLTGTPERTAYRWMRQPHFKQALREAEDELTEQAMRRLLSMQGEAIDALQAILSSQSTPPGQKLRAVEVALGQALRFRNHVDLETRLAELEEVVHQVAEKLPPEQGE